MFTQPRIDFIQKICQISLEADKTSKNSITSWKTKIFYAYPTIKGERAALAAAAAAEEKEDEKELCPALESFGAALERKVYDAKGVTRMPIRHWLLKRSLWEIRSGEKKQPCYKPNPIRASRWWLESQATYTLGPASVWGSNQSLLFEILYFLGAGQKCIGDF